MSDNQCPNCDGSGQVFSADENGAIIEDCLFCGPEEEKHPEEPVSFTDVFGDDDPEGDDWQNDEYDEGEYDDLYEDDGQPSEYDEWQDYMGGDDWDHGQFDDYGEDW